MTVSDRAAQTGAAPASGPPAGTAQHGLNEHISFLRYDGFRYLWWAIALMVLSLVMYIVVRPYGSRFGGGVTGYTLGTIGALLILWLTWFGYKKRRYDSPEAGRTDPRTGREKDDLRRLARRLSAHVYLGGALLFVATLHTGFHFGWNIHTLAYVLMCVVIFSGMFGVAAYASYPRRMTENRENLTTAEMLRRLAAMDDELRVLALPLDDAATAVVDRAIGNTLIGGSAWRQLSNSYPDCQTAAAVNYMDAAATAVPEAGQDVWRQVRLKLDEKASLLGRIRRDARYKAIMEIWLYLHVPFTFALLAALSAHVFSMFFLW